MKIFLTGSASALAAALLPRLCHEPLIEAIYGVDLKKTNYKHPKLKTCLLDIRDMQLVKHMQGYDTVIHLAFIVKRENKKISLDEMKDINVRGSCAVVDAAVSCNINKFINMGTAAVYGAGENFTEDAPLNPSPKFIYANHKMLLEQYLFEKIPTAINFRPHLILGKHAPFYLRSLFKSPIWIKFPADKVPKQQIIHEQDIVQAIMLAIKLSSRGNFNLAAPETLYLLGRFIKGKRRVVGIPFSWIKFLLGTLKLTHINREYDLLEMLQTTATVDCSKARSQLGWRPQFTIEDIRTEVLETL